MSELMTHPSYPFLTCLTGKYKLDITAFKKYYMKIE